MLWCKETWIDDVLSVGCELTGDTVQLGKNAWGNARDASIMYVGQYCVFSVHITD